MLKILKTCLTVVAVSALVATPVSIVIATDAAYAKNGNGNGGGNGGGNGKGGGNGGGNGKGGGNAGGKSDKGQSGSKGGASKSGGSKSKSKDKATAARSGSGKGFKLRDLFKGNKTKAAKAKPAKRKVVATTKRVAKAPVKARVKPVKAHVAPKVRPEKLVKGVLHPSNLGKLNGALNSSPKAKLAHIANGTFTGPVGLSAALALADYTYGIDVADFEAAEEILAVAEAFELIENAPTPEELAAAEALINNGVDDGQADLDAQAALDYPDLSDALALTDGVDAAPTADEIADAESAVAEGAPSLDDVIAAEEDVLAAYMGALDEAGRTEVLEAVRGALPSDDAIAAALPEEAADPADDEERAAVDDEDIVLVSEDG